MAIKVQPSFSSGELDPALHERTTLDKYRSGLKTARNVVVSKSGRLASKPGRKHLVQTKLTDRRVVIHAMSHSNTFVEMGHEYARVYTFNGTLIGDYSHSITESMLDDIQFVDISYHFVMILVKGAQPGLLITSSGGGFTAVPFGTVNTPGGISIGAGPGGAGTGYIVEYVVSVVINGEESLPANLGGGPLPINPLEGTRIVARAFNIDLADVQEMRVYRRPADAGSYGFIGSTTKLVTSGDHVNGTFDDVGQDADYTHSPITLNPTLRNRKFSTPASFGSKTGIVYQQRLVLSSSSITETGSLEASRTAFPYNFYRDYPLADDSSLSFKAGSKGYSEILRLMDHDGLIAFTSTGIFSNIGALGIFNLTMERKGDWVIDDFVPPISIPGGILFIDSRTNTVRQLSYSDESRKYIAEELSIFSDHLFSKTKVRAWTFQDGTFPLLWVVFTNGTYASFTYEREHQMKAWTRHDSDLDVEFVAGTSNGVDQLLDTKSLPQVLFVVNKGGKRYIELGIPRYVSAVDAAADSESDMQESMAAMDAVVSWSALLNDDLTDDDITIAPVVADTWDGDLTLSVVDDAIFPDPGAGAVGTIFRHFDPTNKTVVDLEVTARASDNSVTVSPSATFPSTIGTNPRLYKTQTTFTSLDHLDDESVSVIVDGAVVSSPNNDIENYPISTPSGGSLTLPDSLRGAIVHIGRPYTSDVETLDIDTVEQRPVLIESKTLNKLYLKTHESRSLYIGNTFPDDDKVDGMEAVSSYFVDDEADVPIIGNRYPQNQSRRYEIEIPGDWKSQGRVCIRQVDPVHFEILSIIPDLEDQRR